MKAMRIGFGVGLAALTLSGCAQQSSFGGVAASPPQASSLTRLSASIPEPSEIGHNSRPVMARMLGQGLGGERIANLGGPKQRSNDPGVIVSSENKVVAVNKTLDPSEFDPNKIYR